VHLIQEPLFTIALVDRALEMREVREEIRRDTERRVIRLMVIKSIQFKNPIITIIHNRVGGESVGENHAHVVHVLQGTGEI
jgi:hypothetical protein